MSSTSHFHYAKESHAQVSYQHRSPAQDARSTKLPEAPTYVGSPDSASKPGATVKECVQRCAITALGKPACKKFLCGRDYWTLLVQTICCVVAILTVANTSVVLYLGQINQLVVLGILLTVMGKSFQGRMRFLLLSLEFNRECRVQNLDSIIRNDAFLEQTSIWVRIVLALAYILPLGLGAAYKTFTGSRIHHQANYQDVQFGLTGAPGSQGLGNGLSLMANASLPFFESPRLHTAYGFNMYSDDNQTVYFLDGPLPDDVRSIQNALDHGGTFDMSARAMGLASTDGQVLKAAEQVNINSSESGVTAFPIYPGIFSLILNQNSDNMSDIHVSVFDGPVGDPIRGGDFKSQLRCVHSQRVWCNGSWTVGKTSVFLTHAACEGTTSISQDIIQANFIALGGFAPQINEFITHPVSQGRNNLENIDLVVPAVSAALWARITSLNGAEIIGADTHYGSTPIWYSASPTDVSIGAPALHKSWALFFIILLYPVGSVLVITLRASLFYSTPVDENFGFISLLAGSDSENRQYLDGASLSSKAIEPVRLSVIEEDSFESSSRTVRLRYVVAKERHAGSVKRGVTYK